MRRSVCLGILTLVGVLLTAATCEARQERVDLEVQTITDNLYMLANASTVQGMGGGGNTAIWVMGDGAAYRVPDEYSDFAAPERSLRTTMQYVYEGR